MWGGWKLKTVWLRVFGGEGIVRRKGEGGLYAHRKFFAASLAACMMAISVEGGDRCLGFQGERDAGLGKRGGAHAHKYGVRGGIWGFVIGCNGEGCWW